MATSISDTDKILFLSNLGDLLYERLQQISEQAPRMEHTDVLLGFATDPETFAPVWVVRGDFQPVGTYGENAIVVYALAKLTGFALFDEDHKVCVRRDLDQVQMMFMDEEDLTVQYDLATRLIENLDRLLNQHHQ